MANAQQIAQKIQAGLPAAQVMVDDPRCDGNHLEAIVICECFASKNPIARHRAVYAALGDSFATNLHALKLTTLTPTEAEAKGITI